MNRGEETLLVGWLGLTNPKDEGEKRREPWRSCSSITLRECQHEATKELSTERETSEKDKSKVFWLGWLVVIPSFSSSVRRSRSRVVLLPFPPFPLLMERERKGEGKRKEIFVALATKPRKERRKERGGSHSHFLHGGIEGCGGFDGKRSSTPLHSSNSKAAVSASSSSFHRSSHAHIKREEDCYETWRRKKRIVVPSLPFSFPFGNAGNSTFFFPSFFVPTIDIVE